MNRNRFSRDEIAIGFGVLMSLITLFLIVDLQSGFNLTNDYLPLPDNDKRAFEPENQNDNGPDDDYSEENIGNESNPNTFAALKDKIQLGNIGNYRNYIGKRSRSSLRDITNILKRPFQSKDFFQEVVQAVEYIGYKKSKTQIVEPEYKSLKDFVEYNSNKSNILDKFNLEIKQNEFYAENSTTITELLHEMATGKIVRTENKAGGTQLKLTMHTESGVLSLFKPMRFPRDQQTLENIQYFADFERHTAEIAAFHIDRLLGFRRASPVTGRTVNMKTDIYDLVEEELKLTFFTSPQPDSNRCFHGKCTRYCDVFTPVCGKNDMLEGALIAFYPFDLNVTLKIIRYPWRRSYSSFRKPEWQDNPNYCERVKRDEIYAKGRRLLDVVDLSVFDFLIGNLDRHHYGYFDKLGDKAFPIHYDNGRGFGRAYEDEITILMPLIHCCVIRQSTVETILKFYHGSKPLSTLVRESLASDPVAPVLWEPHYDALDRRVEIILNTIRDCLRKKSAEDVIYPGLNIEDKF